MSPRKIQLSGAFLTPLLFILSGGFLLTPKFASSQCPNGAVQTATYTTKLYGNGTTNYNFSLPQFNPGGGYTLLSAVMYSQVSTGNSITFTNTNPQNVDFGPEISRHDVIKLNSVALQTRAANYDDYPYTYLNSTGTAGDNISYGPGNIYSNNTVIYDSINQSAPTVLSQFQGSGGLTLNYNTSFFINFVTTGVNSTPAFVDTITIGIRYYFCNPIVLSSNILAFSASKENGQTVKLAWEITNEQLNRTYQIEVSNDGQNFAVNGSVPSKVSGDVVDYTYDYSIPPSATGKLYFRLKQVESNSTAAWSDVRIVNLDGNGNGSTFSIYPNPPSDFINLTIPGDNQDWQVDIVAADGSLVQRSYYRNANSAKVSFVRRLAAGTYFVRAVNPQTGKSYSGSFLMR